MIWRYGLFVLAAQALPVWACATCGQSFSFSPKMLILSAGFFILPVSLVGFIAWKLRKDDRLLKDDCLSNDERQSKQQSRHPGP